MAVNQKRQFLLPQKLDFQRAERDEQIDEILSETSKFYGEKNSTTRRPFPGLRWTESGRRREVQMMQRFQRKNTLTKPKNKKEDRFRM